MEFLWLLSPLSPRQNPTAPASLAPSHWDWAGEADASDLKAPTAQKAGKGRIWPAASVYGPCLPPELKSWGSLQR